MSSEALSPRQQMIGMMYLVLTALLALQVTSSVLDRFLVINESLERAVKESNIKNARTVKNIASIVDEKGNRVPDVAVLTKARQIREETAKIVEYTDKLKKRMIEESGGTQENGKPVGSSDEEKVANMMVVKKEGDELQKVLNGYAEHLNTLTGAKGVDVFGEIAHDGDKDPLFSLDEEQRIKDFKSLNFEHVPMAGCLATISELETEVLTYESRALDMLAKQVGAKDLSFDNIVVMVNPESKVVAAGAKYKAEMFIAASASGAPPTMQFNGKDIKVVDGKGIIEFTATGGTYDKDGRVKKTFKGDITMGDSTYENTIEYFVAKPVIQIQSASVSALFLGCGNELNVQVPALGSNYNPSFSATGGSVIKGKTKGLITVVPTSANVSLTVRNDGNLIGVEKFKVKRIPLPTLEVLSRGKPINQKKGESISTLRSLKIHAKPDQSFKEFLPKDARYKVTKWEVTLARGSRPVGSPKRVSSETVNLGDFASRAKAGDRLVIEAKQVQRLNFRGKVENVPIGSWTTVIPLN